MLENLLVFINNELLIYCHIIFKYFKTDILNVPYLKCMIIHDETTLLTLTNIVWLQIGTLAYFWRFHHNICILVCVLFHYLDCGISVSSNVSNYISFPYYYYNFICVGNNDSCKMSQLAELSHRNN